MDAVFFYDAVRNVVHFNVKQALKELYPRSLYLHGLPNGYRDGDPKLFQRSSWSRRFDQSSITHFEEGKVPKAHRRVHNFFMPSSNHVIRIFDIAKGGEVTWHCGTHRQTNYHIPRTEREIHLEHVDVALSP